MILRVTELIPESSNCVKFLPIFTQKNPTSRQKYFCKKSRRSRYSSHWNMGKCNSLLWKNNQTYINIHNSTIINILYLCATLHANDGLPPFPEHENEMTGGHPLYVAMLGSTLLIPKDARDAVPIPNKVDLAVRTGYQKCKDLSRTNCGDIVGHSHAKYCQFIKSSKGHHK